MKYPLRCLQQNCESTTERVSNFIRHFETYHYADVDVVEAETDGTAQPLELAMNVDDDNVSDIEVALPADLDIDADVDVDMLGGGHQGPKRSFTEEMSDLKEALKRECLDVLVSLRSKGNIPLKVSLDVVQFATTIINLVVDKISNAIEDEFGHVDVGPDGLKGKIEGVKKDLLDIKTVMPSFSSEYKIRNVFDHHPLFVSPQTIVLGHRHELKRKTVDGVVSLQQVSTPNKAQYIPITSTLRALLQDSSMLQYLMDNNKSICKEGEYTCFQSGDRFKSNRLWNDESKVVVLIQLFFDGLGVTNALRNASTIHNCGIFYFAILNLPPRFNSSDTNIHLVSICNSLDIKERQNLDILLEKILVELSQLEREGIDLETREGKAIKVYCSLAQFTGDNLGVHQILGFIESFSADYCCLLCYATREDMQNLEKEDSCRLRTKIDYDFDVSQLDNLPQGRVHYRGVKSECILNNMDNFHVTENWLNDAMHSILEGVIPYVTGAILFELGELNPLLKAELINNQIVLLFDSLEVDRQNKPCLLNRFLPPGQDLSPKQSAAQQFALFRYLPLMLSDLIDDDESLRFWELFLQLQEIVDLVFSLKHTDSLLNYLAELIQKFLSLFKELFPALSIRPKLHYLIHYPSIIKKNGPMRNYWCMTFERANGCIKLPSHIMNCFVNPQKTLAYRRQCAALQTMIDKKGNRNIVSVKNMSDVSVCDLERLDDFETLMLNVETDTIAVADRITYNSIDYRENSFVVIGVNNQGGYLFGRIEYVVCEDLQNPLLVTAVFNTVDFDQHCYCHVVEPAVPPRQQLCRIDKLLDPMPLDRVLKKGRQLIRLKHYVLTTSS